MRDAYTGTKEDINVNVAHLTIRSENGTANCFVNALDSWDHVFDVQRDYVNITGFTVENATGTDKAGIYLGNGVEHCNISDNNATNNYFGIWLNQSNNNAIYNNTANLNNRGGIYLESSSHNNTLTSNTANYNQQHGLYATSDSTNNEINSNTFCNNNQSGGNYYDIYDADSNPGDHNTCDTTDNWNDTGTTGCTYSCGDPAGTCRCDSCSDCINKLNDTSCTTVILTANITNHAGTCINNPTNFNNKIFDCQGYAIDGDGMGTGNAIYLDGKKNNTIKNCIITDFNIGIYLTGEKEKWHSDSSLKSGLGDVGDNSAPAIADFNNDGKYELISGEWDGVWNAWYWDGTEWISDSSLKSGLTDVGWYSAPAIADFNNDGKYELISGEYDGVWNAWYWNGSKWIKDSSLKSGLTDVGDKSNPAIADFNNDGKYELIGGEGNGVWNAWYWNGSKWIKDSSLKSGLTDVGYRSNPVIADFNNDGKYELISGEFDGVWNAWYWNGSKWIKDSSLKSGLTDVGQSSAPAIADFNNDRKYELISGEYDGKWNAWYWTDAAQINLTNNTISDCDYGIKFMGAENCIFENNEISSNNYGIYFNNSDSNDLINNTVTDNTNTGVYFNSDSGNNNLTSNFICRNGVDVDDSDGNSGDENTCSKSGSWADDGRTSGCTYSCSACGCSDGTYNYICGETVIESCTMNCNLNSTGTCFTVGADDITINGNGYSITGNTTGSGIYVNDKSNVTIKNLKIYNFTNGIYTEPTKWVSDSSLKSGLNYVGGYSNPAIADFNNDGKYELISGESDGTWNAWYWDGSKWISDSSLKSGLTDVGHYSAPAMSDFNNDGKYELISGEYDGVWNAWYWNGSKWIKDSSLKSGLTDVGDKSNPAIADFNNDGKYELISGEQDGIWNAWYWNGSKWIKDSSLKSGLTDVGLYSTPAIADFNNDGKYELISGESDGTWNAWYWNGNKWISDSSLKSGLTDVGSYSTPAIADFNNDGKYELISGEKNGNWDAWYWSTNDHINLTNNTISNCDYGIKLMGVRNSTVKDNEITSNTNTGVYFSSTANNNTLTSNFICWNGLDVDDDDSNTGDENTCNTTNNWNDIGTTGCRYSCPTCGCVGANYTFVCGQTVNQSCNLTCNLNSNGTCFTIGADNITIDGASFSITGNTTGNGIYANGRNNLTIKNLNVYSFWDGIYLVNSNNSQIINNTANNNTQEGIHLEAASKSNNLTGNTASGNTLWDFYSDAASHDNMIEDLTIASYPTTISFTYDNGVGLKGVTTPPEPDPAGKANISKYVNATNVTADSWIFLNVSYEEGDLGGAGENSLRMWKHNGTDWTEVPGTNGVNTAENYVYANITEFGSIFAPLGNPHGPPVNCTCGDICVNTSGWWRGGGAFNASNTPIQHAIDSATAGDTICVKDGTYNENVDVTKSHLTIRSENGSSVTTVSASLNPDAYVFNITDQTNVTLEGFTVRDASGTSQDVAGIYMENASDCNISNNFVTNISATGFFSAYGIWLFESTNNSFSSGTNVSYVNATASDGWTTDAYGIYLSYYSNNNSFNSNTSVSYVNATASGSDTDANADGIYLYSSNNNSFGTSTSVSYVNATASGGYTHAYADGICLYDSDDNSFGSSTSVSYVNATATASGGYADANGIYLRYSSDNNEFYDCTISDLTAGEETTYGVYMYSGSDNNIISRAKISRGAGPYIDYGVYMRDCSDDFILDSNVSDCRYGIYIDDKSAHTMSGNTIYDV